MKIKYMVYYKNKLNEDWRLHGLYTKTDALGTANLLLKNDRIIKIVPVEIIKS